MISFVCHDKRDFNQLQKRRKIMAINFSIANTPVIMVKFFAETDKAAALDLIPAGARRALFVDTPSTKHLHTTIVALQERGVTVAIRDHHDIVGDPVNDREAAIHLAADAIRERVRGEGNGDCVISTRDEHPACSTLIEAGEFADVDAVIADPDPDGLLGAMKALGVTYPELDSDAAVLDGPRSEQTPERLSALAVLLVKGMATLPPFNPKNPSITEKAKGDLFSQFVSAVEGDAEARASLEVKVEAYEQGVGVARGLVSKATEPVVGVKMVDAVGSPRHDLMTLTRGLETGDTMVTVVRKDNGPIAAAHDGVQYSLAVVRKHQAEVNLQELLTPGFVSSPESGIISNTTFLLHVSQEVWDNQVLPALRDRFAA
jgi:hypothetical protein